MENLRFFATRTQLNSTSFVLCCDTLRIRPTVSGTGLCYPLPFPCTRRRWRKAPCTLPSRVLFPQKLREECPPGSRALAHASRDQNLRSVPLMLTVIHLQGQICCPKQQIGAVSSSFLPLSCIYPSSCSQRENDKLHNLRACDAPPSFLHYARASFSMTVFSTRVYIWCICVYLCFVVVCVCVVFSHI